MTTALPEFFTPRPSRLTSKRQQAQQMLRQRMGHRAWLLHGLDSVLMNSQLLPGEATKLADAYQVVSRLYLAAQADMKNLKTLIPDHLNTRS